MVKKLISGILNKNKDKKEPAKKEEEVPDELPSLGEEAPQEGEQKEDAKETGNTAGPGEPPEELPGLEEEPEKVAEKEAPSVAEKAAVEAAALEREEEEKPAAAEQVKPASDAFFATIGGMIFSGKPVDKLLSQDLVANMKENWGIRRESARSGLSSIQEKGVNQHLSQVLTELRLMEGKWRALRMVMEEDERALKEQEEKLRQKEKELKMLLRRAKLYQPAPEDKVILLKNSIPVRNISEMVNALRRMDSRTFQQHVHKKKNAFSELAAAIDSRLGGELRKAHTKDAMLKALDAYVKRVS